MMVRLLHMGAIDSINSLDHEGNSALHFAAAHCDPEYVQVTSLHLSPDSDPPSLSPVCCLLCVAVLLSPPLLLLLCVLLCVVLLCLVLLCMRAQYLLICGAEKGLRNQNNRLPFEEARVCPIPLLSLPSLPLTVWSAGPLPVNR
jgi:hypothetical protein